MTNNVVKILVVDDEKAIRNVLMASLADEGYQVQSAEDGLTGLSKIKTFKPDIVFLDIWMPGEMDGIALLKRAKEQFPNIQFIIMSGHGTIETAVRATKFGAWDFIEKPLSMDRIFILISNIVSFNAEKNQKNTLLQHVRKNLSIVGNSANMIMIKQMISRSASTDMSLLIKGEKGTGKKLAAENIHYLSARAGLPLITVHCSQIPEELMDAEIFGAEGLAFINSENVQIGKLELANGGTLIFEEISKLTLPVQEKLASYLKDKKYFRKDASQEQSADVRILATTSVDLAKLVDQGLFSSDLYSRLSQTTLAMPTLFERKGDLAVLISHFSSEFSKHGGFLLKSFSPEALQLMGLYKWPGNIRELRNFVERLYILTPSDLIDAEDIKFAGLNLDEVDIENFDTTFRAARARFEKEFILKAIEENQGNISKTAENIGLERSYLHRKIKTYGIDL